MSRDTREAAKMPWQRCLGALLWVVNRTADPLFRLVNYRKGRRIPPIKNPILLESATSLAEKIRNGELKSEDVVRAYIERIKEVNPIINSVVDQRYEEALQEARNIDIFVQSTTRSKEQLAKELPFLGIPVSVKESLAVKGLSHTAGSRSRANHKAEKDAVATLLIRQSGAIPLVVTNVPEMCMCWETFNKLYGTTKNPYDTNRTPGGSSGGEAALQGAGGSLIGLVSDVAGSARIPAMFTGVFGHKPTPVVVSGEGHIPAVTDEQWHRFFTVAVMSRYAVDMLPMMKVIVGRNSHKLQLDKKVNVAELKYYYMEDDGGSPLTLPVHPEIQGAIRRFVTYLDDNYGIKAQKVKIRQLYKAFEIAATILLHINGVPNVLQKSSNSEETKNVLVETVKCLFHMTSYTSPPLIYCYLKKLVDEMNPRLFEHYKQLNAELLHEFLDLLGDSGVFIYPTFPRFAGYHNQTYYRCFSTSYSMIFNALGMPATNCPMGLGGKGLPMGIQIVAAPYQDHLTLAVAEEVERAFGGWVEPPPFVEEASSSAVID